MALYSYSGLQPEYKPNKFDIVGGFVGPGLDYDPIIVVGAGQPTASTLSPNLTKLFQGKKGGDDILYSCLAHDDGADLDIMKLITGDTI